MASAIGSFVSNIWKVHRPLFEQEGYEAQQVVDDKPPAKLPDAAEVSEEARANIKNDDDAKQVGVAIAEATYALTGKTWYIMMASLIIAYFVFALDNITTLTYLFSSMFALGGAGDYYTAAAIQGVVVGVAKLVIGKLADIYGRFTASVFTLFFYVLGFLVLAVAQNSDTQIAGAALQAVGNSGLQIVMWVIMADFLSARMRAFGVAFITMPIFITFAVGPQITSALISRTQWRWGFGMFCILVPVAMAPIMSILFYLERKAKKSGLVPKHPYLRYGFAHGMKEFFMDADIGGMILILAGFVFILLPLNRGGGVYQSTAVPWNTPWIIALFVVGGVCLIALPFYELYVSPRPFIRRRWLNSDVVLAMVIAFFDFMTFNISFQMLFQWRSYTLGLDPLAPEASYFTYTDTLSLTIFGVIGGAIIWYTRRFKYLLVFGTILRLVAYGLLIRFRHQGTTMVQAVFPQVILGMGGAFVGEIVTISSQIVVRHQDVAMVTSVVMLCGLIGQSIGTSIYHAVLNDQWPKKLMAYTGVSEVEAAGVITASSTLAPAGPNTPLGMQQIRAYNDAAEHALWAGIVFCAFVVICSLFVKDWIVPRSQNVVSDELPEKNPFRMASDDTYDGAVEQVEKSHVIPPSYNEFPRSGEDVVQQANENVVQQGKEEIK